MSIVREIRDRIGKQWGTLLTIALVLGLVHFTRTRDLFSDFSRPSVTSALHLLGIPAVDHGEVITVGRLEVPWTRDCAGLNLLLVLMAVTFWVNRSEKFGWPLVMKVIANVPAALVANILRVLTLIGIRAALYPAVESPQLHYFLGLVWLLPFILLIVPRGPRPLMHTFTEASHAAAVVALLAPFSGAPGGEAISLAAILCLAQCRYQVGPSPLTGWLGMGWCMGGAGIALLGTESFWLPWLLLCPLLTGRSWLFSLSGILLTAGSYPLIGLIPGGTTLVWAGAAYYLWQRTQASEPEVLAAGTLAGLRPPRLLGVAVCLMFLLPFTASTFITPGSTVRPPPQSIIASEMSADTFDIRIPDQPSNIGLIWFNPSGNGRHHSMSVCMKFRGINLRTTADSAAVMTDGQHWMREFFLTEGRLLHSYREYLLHTIVPRSSPGVHLIFFTQNSEMSSTEFDRQCEAVAIRLEAIREVHGLEAASASLPLASADGPVPCVP